MARRPRMAIAVVALAACWTSAQDPPAAPHPAAVAKASCSRDRLVVRVVGDDAAHEPLAGATVVFGDADESVDHGVSVEVTDESGTASIAPVPDWITFVAVYYGDHMIKTAIPRSICHPIRVVVPTSAER